MLTPTGGCNSPPPISLCVGRLAECDA